MYLNVVNEGYGVVYSVYDSVIEFVFMCFYYVINFMYNVSVFWCWCGILCGKGLFGSWYGGIYFFFIGCRYVSYKIVIGRVYNVNGLLWFSVYLVFIDIEFVINCYEVFFYLVLVNCIIVFKSIW